MNRPRSGSAGSIALFLVFSLAASIVAMVFASTRPIVAGTLLFAVFGPALMIVSGRPRLLCLCGVVFFTPLELSKFWMISRHVGGEYALRIEAVDLFLVPLILFQIGDLARERSWRVRIPRAAFYWSVLLILALGTVAFGPFRTAAALEAIRMMKVLLLFLCLVNEIERPAQLRAVAGVLVAGLVLQSLYGLLQYFTGATFGLDRMGEAALRTQDIGSGLAVETHRRIGALLGHPNIFSCYLAMLLSFVVALLFCTIPVLLRALSIAGLALGLPALLATLSRNGWAAFGLGLVLVVILTRRHPELRRRTAFGRMAIVVVIAVGILASSNLIIDRFLKTGTTSTDARWVLNGIALDMALDRPILGHGKNSLAYVMASTPEYRLKPPYSRGKEDLDPETAPPIHNIYMQQWAEQGTVGLLVFAGMLVSVIIVGARNLRVADPMLFAMNLGYLAGVVAIVFHGFFDWIFWINPMLRMFWLFAAGVLSIRYIDARQRAAALPEPEYEPALSGTAP